MTMQRSRLGLEFSNSGSISSPQGHANPQSTDAMIARMLEHKRMLQERRNTILAVRRLPPETLSEIFRYCAPSPAFLWQGPKILAFSQVCRTWRRVAFADPFIWTSPLCSIPHIGRAMIERAKTLPLNLEVDCSGDSDCFNAVISALTSIVTFSGLNVTASSGQWEEIVKLLGGHLHVSGSVNLQSKEPTRLDVSAFKGTGARTVKVLRLTRCALVWNFQAFSSLVVLEIVANEADERLTLAWDLVETLKRCPRLTTLRLENSLGLTNAAPFEPPSTKVTLRHLTFLTINDDLPISVYLFWHLAFPALETVEIRNDADPEEVPQAITDLFRCLKNWLESDSHLGRISVYALNYRHFDLDRLELSLDCEDEDIGVVDSGTANVSVTLRIDIRTLHEVWQSVSTIFNLTSLAALRLAMGGALVPSDYLDFWRRMMSNRNLKHVHILDESFLTFLEVLETHGSLSPHLEPFPALETLLLENLDMTPFSHETCSTSLRRLAIVWRAMQLRRENEAMPTVCLTRCKVYADPVEVFDKFGVQVTVSDPRILSGYCVAFLRQTGRSRDRFVIPINDLADINEQYLLV